MTAAIGFVDLPYDLHNEVVVHGIGPDEGMYICSTGTDGDVVIPDSVRNFHH